MWFLHPVQGSSLVSFSVIKGVSCAIWAILERVRWFWKPPLERSRMAGANSASRPQSHRAGSECQTPQQNLKVKVSLRFWSRRVGPARLNRPSRWDPGRATNGAATASMDALLASWASVGMVQRGTPGGSIHILAAHVGLQNGLDRPGRATPRNVPIWPPLSACRWWPRETLRCRKGAAFYWIVRLSSCVYCTFLLVPGVASPAYEGPAQCVSPTSWVTE